MLIPLLLKQERNHQRPSGHQPHQLEALLQKVSIQENGVNAPTSAVDIIANVMYNVHMKELRFEWDGSKSRQNKRKHGVSFEEAQSVFLDERAIRFFDPDHSEEEERFILLGMSFVLRVLVVCHCYRAEDSIIRIISARKANELEVQAYSAYWS